jgi:DNA-binding response OmpR family regulator
MDHREQRSKTILIVDDEEHILQMLLMNMKTQGYRGLTALTGEEALDLAERELPDLILLDVMLPDLDGVEICRRLKADPKTGRIPVLMVSAKSESRDKINGFQGGADDYITKPFSLEELFLRIRAALRQVDLLTAAPAEFHQGNLTLNTERYQVQADGRKIDLTLTEFRILHLLLKNKGHLVTRDLLIEEIFEMDPAESSRSLDVHLRNIRRKLECSRVAGCEIETIRGQGYQIG